jgi:putative pyruvate formate lyase activating enzyme
LENTEEKAEISSRLRVTPWFNILPPKRYLSKQEYDSVLGWLDEFGIEDGFCQELVTGSDWLPDFRRPNPFSSDLSVPVWHW